MKTIVSHSLDETQELAAKWLSYISAKYGNENEAVLFGLSGHLGAGKTAFVKALAKELGVKEDITSPTFVIMKIYEINTHLGPTSLSKVPPWKHLVHIDAYRLERPEELEALRFEDVMADKNNLVIVEWPEQVKLEAFDEKERIKFSMTDNRCSIEFSNDIERL